MSEAIDFPDFDDSPTTRITINQISTDELDQFIAAIRQRRLAIDNIIQRTKAARNRSDDDLAKAEFDKLMKRVDKKRENIDKLINELETMTNRMKVLEIELS